MLVYSVSNGNGDAPLSRKPQAATSMHNARQMPIRSHRLARFWVPGAAKWLYIVGLSDNVDEFSGNNNDAFGFAAFKEAYCCIVLTCARFDIVLAGRCRHLNAATQFAIDLQHQFDLICHQGAFIDLGPGRIQEPLDNSGGRLRLPTGPGLGLRFDMDFMRGNILDGFGG